MYDCTVAGGTALAAQAAIAAARLGLRTALIEPPNAWELSALRVGPQWTPEMLELVCRREDSPATTDRPVSGRPVSGRSGSGRTTQDHTLSRRLACLGQHRAIQQKRDLQAARVDSFTGHPRVLGADSSSIVIAAQAVRSQSHGAVGESGPSLVTRMLLVAMGSIVAPVRQESTLAAFHGKSNQVSSGATPLSLGELLLSATIPQTLAVLGSNPWAEAVAKIYTESGSDVVLIGRRLPQRSGPTKWREYRLGVSGIRGRGPLREIDLCSGERVLAEQVVCSSPEVGCTGDLGLSLLGIETDECGRLWCDAAGRTWHPRVYAVGSVVGFPEELSQPEAVTRLLEGYCRPPRHRATGSSSHPGGMARVKSPKWLSAAKASSPQDPMTLEQ